MGTKLLFGEPLDDELLARLTTPGERALAEDFNPRRRREWLSWRAMLRRELGGQVRIAYAETGAPLLPDRPEHIAVAHCPGHIALMIADVPCALDIEPADRNFSRSASRFMTDAERRLSDDPLWAGMVWCAKETLYKLAGRRELDLREDLRIEAYDPASGLITGRIAAREPLRLRVERRDGCLLVRTI